MTKFIQEDTGVKYEEAKGEILTYTSEGVTVPPYIKLIRPVKQEPKWLIHETDKNYIKIELFGDAIDQAQLIKEAVETLMEYITTGQDGTWRDKVKSPLPAMEKARVSMRENN